MKRYSVIFMIILLSGCTFDSGVSEESKNKVMTCTDTRDGETFTFKTNDITNARVGFISDTSFDVVDLSGVKRTLTKSMELYIKCVEVKK